MAWSLMLAAANLEAPVYAAPPQARANALISEIDLRDITVGDALRILSTQYGLNVVASEKASRIKTALFLRDVKPIEVLDAISKAYNLWYQEDPQSKIVRLFTVEEFRLGQVDSVPEQVEVFTLKYPNATDVAYVIRNLYGDRVRLGMASNQQEVSQELQARFQRFSIVDRQRTGTLGGGGSTGGGGGGGGSTSSLEGFTNQQNRIDKQDIQEAIGSAKNFTDEASTKGLVAGSEEEAQEAMGGVMRKLSTIYVTVIRAQNRVLVRCRDPEAMDKIRALVKKLDVSQSTLLMEVKILSVDLSDDYQSAFDFILNAGDFTLAGFPLAQPLAGRALLAAVVNDKFTARLSMLEKEGRVTTLATPMLMTTNQEVSRVFVGQEVPITTGYNSSTSSGTATTPGTTAFNVPILVPQTTTRPIGTTLLLTPNINADHTVNIRLLVEQSSLSPNKAEIPIPSATNTSGLLQSNIPTAPVDIVNTQYFSGVVLGQDEVAVAVGGLIQDTANDQQNKTPILGDVPLLGLLFKNEQSQRGRKEMIIIIKPHIQETPTESAGDSEEFLHNESVHPNARAMGGNMDIYRNPGRHHDDYELQQRYKYADVQDDFDEYHRRTRNPAEEPSMPPDHPPAFPPREEAGAAEGSPQDYLGLTRFAAHAVRQADVGKELPQGVAEAGLVFVDSRQIFADSRVQAEPLESWKKGALYVTTVQVRNNLTKTLAVDMGQLSGQWLASTLEKPKLAPKGKPGDFTYLYLVSKEPFHEAVRR